MKSLFTFFLAMGSVLTAFGQDTSLKIEPGNVVKEAKATLRGSVIDDETGEALIGVNVFFEGTNIGTITDIDGQFSLQAPAGQYTIAFSYLSYASTRVSGIMLTGGAVEALDVRLMPETTLISEVVISAAAVRNTETAILTIQKKSANLLDGISSQSFGKTGDGDAAAAIRRVTGVTVEGGKYIYIRGLGDRYSKSVLNGLEIPGLDPERNTVQMDIFPSNIIDNIIVYKSFTPDLPGDFTGGMVDIRTLDFPTRRTIKVSASLGLDTETQFRDEFILFKGHASDAVGFGKSARQLRFSKDYNPSKNEAQTLFDNTNSLSKEIGAVRSRNFLNQSYAVSYGNQVDKGAAKWGYFGALSYKNDYSFRPDVERADVRIVPSGGEAGYDFERLTIRTGQVGSNESLVSAMLSGSYKKGPHKLSLKYLHTQTGERNAAAYRLDDIFNTQLAIENDLSYVQRMISNTILNGEHIVGHDIRLSWGNAFTYTSMDEPDLTSSEFTIDRTTGDTLFQSGSSNFHKIYRELSEINNNSRLEMELPFRQWGGLEAKFKAGFSGVIKRRDFETYVISIGKSDNFSADLTIIDGGLNTILAEENLYGPQNNTGYVISNVQVDDENKYTSLYSIMAVYGMVELPLAAWVKFIGGMRSEYALMQYRGTERLSGDAIDRKVLNSWQYLPSASFVFHATESMNLRTSYSRTLARPSFREKSESILFDPVEGTTYYGNLDLVETHIHNADLRWEYFFGRGEIVSLSGFFKRFMNPIEIEPLENAGANNIRPVNRDQADVYGFEVELRKNLSFLHEKLSDLSLGTNFTWIRSRIGLSQDQKDKYELIGLEAPDHRDLLGQSPYVVNASLNYSNTGSGTDIALTYNVKGKTLTLVGIGDIPDVFEAAFHNLDFKVSQSVGRQRQAKLSLTAQNLLGQSSNHYYEFLGESAGNYNRYARGRKFSLGFSYSL